MKTGMLCPGLLLWACVAVGQAPIDGISSEFTLQQQRDRIRQHLFTRTIGETFRWLPADRYNEHRYQSACEAITQYQLVNSEVLAGLTKAMDAYSGLSYETRRAILEAAYTVNPAGFGPAMEGILRQEAHPRLFAMAALFVERNEPSRAKELLRLLSARFSDYRDNPILSSLEDFLWHHRMRSRERIPDPAALFQSQAQSGVRTVYSFQRWNRDHPGLAVIQGEDGRFLRDSAGRLMGFRQLARSGSNLPYFITNGNTPQGAFRILGRGVSMNPYIGPTPNLQLIMPFEGLWSDYLHLPADSTDPLSAYRSLFPDAWKPHESMLEAFRAGKAGRTEIIAHGTTIDPDYYRDKPYHPISPSLGCLCAPETWDVQTGRLVESEQYRLASAFFQDDGKRRGYLIVINLDDRESPVTMEELAPWIDRYEASAISGAHPAGASREWQRPLR